MLSEIRNQKSGIRNIKLQWRLGVGGCTQKVLTFLSTVSDLSSTFIEYFVPGTVLVTQNKADKDSTL